MEEFSLSNVDSLDGRRDLMWSRRFHLYFATLLACFLGIGGVLASAPAGGAASSDSFHSQTGMSQSVRGLLTGHSSTGKLVVPVDCTFNGVASNGVLGGTLKDVYPGEAVEIVCFGAFLPGAQVDAGEESPLVLTSSNPPDETDGAGIEYGYADSAGSFDGVFTMPNPFVAPDPNAVCPPTAGQGDCILVITDGTDLAAVNVEYGAAPVAPSPAPASAAGTFTGMAATPNGAGYWLVTSTGAVSPHGNAVNYGSMAGQPLAAPISHIVATPNGLGYWLVAADGGTFAFGDAGFYGSMGGQHLNAPVVDLAPTRDGGGYWLVAADGGIFAFGDAAFHGSMGGQRLNEPIVGISADNATGGYWEVATDGGIFAFGAPFLGSTGAIHLNSPVNGMTSTADDSGYWFVASDGGIFAYGDAGFYGSTGSIRLNKPVVGMAADVATGGYWLVAADGGIFAYNAPFYGAG
jgi:hypothetical protein